jgi:hypothetical protein
MSESILIDPARGFVALPAQILDLEISPGAFRVLTHLCNLADVSGWSWSSLEQFAERIGRAKSSVSAYLQELRTAGLIKTQQQTRNNGAFYRLKICVTFWADWVKSRVDCGKAAAKKQAQKTAPKTERRVQPVERPKEDKHKTIKTHSSGKPGADTTKIWKGWQALTKGQPFGQFARDASPALLQDTSKLLEGWIPTPALSRSSIEKILAAIWRDVGASPPALVLRAQVAHCVKRKVTQANSQALADHIRKTWKPHWQKPPTPAQFGELVAEARKSTPIETVMRLVSQDYNRYLATVGAQKTLCKAV